MGGPNRTFVAVVLVSTTLMLAALWSAHHLLVAGAPVLASGAWPGLSCLLLPAERDLPAHLASYAFLAAIAAATTSGLWTLVQQYRQTRSLLQACLALRSPRWRALRPVVQGLGLEGRVDVVEIPAPMAFCYGYIRPRILVSTGLLASLPRQELEALLLHEREHLRQRDPLKVAIGKLLASAVFFAPLVGALHRRYLVEKELAADRAAIVEQGSSDSLAAALLRLIEVEGQAPPAYSAGGDEALEARIDVLLGNEAPQRAGMRLKVGRSAAVALLAVLPLVMPGLSEATLASSHNIVGGCHLAT